jgi:hypothetical protein
LQKIGWHLRSYILPSHVQTYWRIVREHALTTCDAGQRFVYFDFTSMDIEAMAGRYLFSLVCSFEALGFVPCYRKNFRFLASMKHRKFKRLLLERPFRICKSMAELPENSVVAEVTDRPRFRDRVNHKQIRVRYDVKWPESSQEVPMTFFVYPQLHDRWLACPAPDLAGQRPWRIFFAGRFNRNYGTDALQKKFGKMSRCQILAALQADLPAGQLTRLKTAADLETAAAGPPHFFWADSAQFQIPQSEWLEVLNRADFFLACPGSGMPLCHNLIESLSRGAVPILEHPEFLDPPLEHGVNCLSFKGRSELLKTFAQALQLDQGQISRLRHGAYAYYQQHLAPGAFAKHLLDLPGSHVDVLLNAYRIPRPLPAASRAGVQENAGKKIP